MERTLLQFMTELSSAAPVPGGGGASAVAGALSASLCSMVANLTTGKKKYAEYQPDIDRILEETTEQVTNFLSLMKKDAVAFEPLSKAYSIPKDQPNRAELLEQALVEAAKPPFEILEAAAGLTATLEELSVKGSRLAISDVACAASACRCAAESASMNVLINTKLMKNKSYAQSVNEQTLLLLERTTESCNHIVNEIQKQLLSQ